MKNSMTIYYFCFEGFKKIGRLNNHITETVNWLAKFGHKIHFFNPDIIAPELNETVKIHLIPIINLPVLRWITFDIFAFFKMVVHLLQKRPDLIYYRESSSLVPLVMAKLFSIPLLVEINGWVLGELSEINYPKHKLSFIRTIQKLNYKYADRLVPVSEGLKNLIGQEYKLDSAKISVVPNGTNPEKYYPIKKTIARKKAGLPQQEKIIGFIGGCYPHHGIHYLIDAAPLVLQKLPETQFVIAGDGAMLKKWQEQARRMGVSDNFYFPGNVPYDLAPYYINSFDICVAPWDEEQVGSVGLSPMKLFDYLACGRPIVTSSIYGVREIIEKERIGTTVDVRDKKNFAAAIVRILENPAKYEKMAIKGREIIIQHYTWKRTAEQIEKLCRNELK